MKNNLITDIDTIQRGTSEIKMYNENDAMIDIGPNQNEGEGLLPTLGHSRQDMNPFEEEFDRFWRDNQNEVIRRTIGVHGQFSTCF